MNEGVSVSSASNPFVSVVVPVYNDRDGIERCLDALAGQTYPGDRYEVIVVDNGSADPLDDLAQRHRISLTHEPKIGSYAARNRGIAQAAGEVIAFIDSDCTPRENWIERGVATLQREPECGMVVGGVDLVLRDPGNPNAVELFELRTRFNQRENLARRRYAPTANLITRRSVIDTVGPFDARFLSSGDFEWCRRVFAAGYAQVYDDDVRVSHPTRRSLRELSRYRRRLVGGQRLRANTSADPPARGAALRFGIGLVPPLFATKAAAADVRVTSVPQLLKLGLVIWFVRWVEGLESVRLALGGNPRR